MWQLPQTIPPPPPRRTISASKRLRLVHINRTGNTKTKAILWILSSFEEVDPWTCLVYIAWKNEHRKDHLMFSALFTEYLNKITPLYVRFPWLWTRLGINVLRLWLPTCSLNGFHIHLCNLIERQYGWHSDYTEISMRRFNQTRQVNRMAVTSFVSFFFWKTLDFSLLRCCNYFLKNMVCDVDQV